MKNKYSLRFWSVGFRQICLVLVVLPWLGALVLRAATHYTCPYNEAQANPYTTWGTAGTNIIDVVNAAMTNTPSRLVYVSNGVYVLTNQIVITNELTLQSIDGHGPADTIINGNFTPGTPETNRCLLMSNAAAFVSGLTFSNGAYMPPAANIGGGGVQIYSGTLSNCTVRNNLIVLPTNLSTVSSVGGGGVYMSGGTAIACRVTDNIVTNLKIGGSGAGGGIWTSGNLVDNCLISNNIIYYSVSGNPYSAGYGGGVYLYTPGLLRSCLICYNRTMQFATTPSQGGDGGGVMIYGNSAIMEACTATLNQAVNQGGGVRIDRGTITNCVISYNSATTTPGGLYIFAGGDTRSLVFNTTIANNTGDAVRIWNTISPASTTPDVLVNCVITNNSGLGVNPWPGVYVYKKTAISNCVIRGNGGGVGNFHYGTIQNCLIANNTGTVGGLTIYKTCSTVSVSCCTIVKNRDTDSPGSGLYIDATNIISISSLSISSCIIYSNGVSGTDDVYDARAPTNYSAISYSCLGTNYGFNGAGLITNRPPQFINSAEENFRLAANSPGINAGTNQNWMTNSVDLDGRTRIRYGTVDMGAYERIQSGTSYGFH